MMKILDELRKPRLYFDGGTGTVLQAIGLRPEEKPEEWNLSHPDKIVDLHLQYLNAGADIVDANTFGVNPLKYENAEELIRAALSCARQAVERHGSGYVAYDMGPTGQLLEPLGTLSFEEAVEAFGKCARYAQTYGADLILIETMNDSYETKAAVLGAKENCTLPVFVTNVFDESHKLMTGASPRAMIAMLEGMGVDAIGMNCSLGPEQMLDIAREYVQYATIPVIVSPNAGLPTVRDGKTVFDVDADRFSDIMREIASCGASILGGCCGTTPEYIRKTVEKTKNIPLKPPSAVRDTVISSYTHAVVIGDSPVLIGERINPTGKKKVKEALRNRDYAYILSEGVAQIEAGASVLDVNAGLPEIDEAAVLSEIVRSLQSVTDAPLQIDTADAAALERAMRLYNGKPLVNSVNGSKKSMAEVFPLVKKYGGAVIALTMDENGIPETAQGRYDIAARIVAEAAKYGISARDIIADPLAMTISSDSRNAVITLDAIRLIRRGLGIRCSLGVSNVSFGLPLRDSVNATFFVMAMSAGLNAAIMNPYSQEMMRAWSTFRALSGMDENCSDFLAFAADGKTEKEEAKPKTSVEMTLMQAVVRGLTDTAQKCTQQMLETMPPLTIIDTQIIPALEEIGRAFEEKRAYLPQLLMSADAARAAFAEIQQKLPSSADRKKRIVLATVKGDIHDIGKNIVRALLENFGFYVEDLGRDVPPEVIAQAAVGCRMVGLSALMTTTVPAMEETIRLLRKVSPETVIVVGGAVLTQEYAAMIGADIYAANAMETVRAAQQVFSAPEARESADTAGSLSV